MTVRLMPFGPVTWAFVRRTVQSMMLDDGQLRCVCWMRCWMDTGPGDVNSASRQRAAVDRPGSGDCCVILHSPRPSVGDPQITPLTQGS
jgi:hypothetical protein